jgi:hypothetical protein
MPQNLRSLLEEEAVVMEVVALVAAVKEEVAVIKAARIPVVVQAEVITITTIQH